MILPPSNLALPTIKTLQDCTSFHQTVSPYIPQLQALPAQLLSHAHSASGLLTLYTTTNPLITGVALSLFLAPLFLLISEANKNYSQVDRVWSILPTLYHAHYALWARLNGLPTGRVDAALMCSALWSVRLTFNYWRKGGYQRGSEDYRWAVLRERIPAGWFFLFNVTFISTAQSILLFLITTPTYILLLTSTLQPPGGSGSGADTTDAIFARIITGLVLLEFVADQQQWAYQQSKTAYQRTARLPPNGSPSRAALDRGFLTAGLWRYVRHPNFAAEQAIWLVWYGWAAVQAGAPLNWTALGAAAYVALFQGSTAFTEAISARKYPEYKEYQRRVGCFVPRLWGEGWPVDDREVEVGKGKGK